MNAAGGGLQTYAKFAYQRYNDLNDKTTCKAGYVMERCKGYHAPATALPSPNEILEGIVQGTHTA